MSKFSSSLRYSLGNEDWNVEELALRIRPGDRVFCITASGDRPLHVLLSNCAQVVAIDVNPAQTHLLSLKCAALKALDYHEYLQFLGQEEAQDRLNTFERLLALMPEETVNYWRRDHKKIAKGVLYQGAVERFLQYVSKLSLLIRGRKLKQLFAFEDLDAQRAFIDKEWATTPWRLFFQVFLHPKISRFFLSDTGLTGYVDKSIHPGMYIYERMNASLKHDLAKTQSLTTLVLWGRLISEAAYPPYLTEPGHRHIRQHIDRMSLVTQNAIDYLEQGPENSFDVFSLSDIASYMDQASFERLIKSMLRSARPNAHFCIREFMSKRHIPESMQQHFVRDHALEE